MRRDSKIDFGDLAQELARLRRRAGRQKLRLNRGQGAHLDWSGTMDEIAGLTQRLVTGPADDLDNLALKFKSVLWLIEVNESLLDDGDLRRLRRFGRDLARLAGER
jgi:hypothetical protein